MKRSFVFISIVAFVFVVAAQSPEATRYNFTHYTEDSGLNSYQVNGTVQDDDGYIWIATNEGLQRYDGLRYKSFRPIEGDSTSVPSRSILQVLIDKNKNFWLLTGEGKVGIFDTKNFIFTEMKLKLRYGALLESSTPIKKLISDDFGNVFFLLSGKELATYNKATNEFSAEHNFVLHKPEWAILDFVQQPGTKKYWMCLGTYGFAVYDKATGFLSYHKNNLGQEKIIELYKTDSNPYKLYFDHQGRAWHLGRNNGMTKVYCFDIKKEKTIIDKLGFDQQLSRYHEILHFMQQRDGSVWIYGVNVFAKFLEASQQFQQVYNGYVDDRSIHFVVITDLSEDRERNIWISTANNGLFRFNPSEEFFSLIEYPSKLMGNIGSGAPLTFIQDMDGSILVGVWNDRLYRYDKDLKPLELDIAGFPTNGVTSVLDMRQSKIGKFIWMAAKNGIYKYDQHNRSVQFYPLIKLKSRIREIAEDKNGNLWIGLQEHGVYKWESQNMEGTIENNISKFEPIPSTRINKIMIDSQGYIWIGTYGIGAVVIDPDNNKVIEHINTIDPERKGFKDRTVTTLLDYNDSIVLIGTKSSLLSYHRRQQKLSVLEGSETISGSICSMEKDTDGNVWLSTTSGLYRVNIYNGVFIKFNRKEGIRNDYFITSSSYVLPDGRMLFGASRTMVAFDPAKIKLNNDNTPTVHITDFKVMNRSRRIDSLLQKKVIALAYNENSITIDLSTLSYKTAYAIHYKLDGLDNEWKVIDRTYQLNYPYLPSGTYTLLVNLITAEGGNENNAFSLNIEVGVPYWKTWWFYGILTLLIGIIMFWFDKFRIQQKVAVHKMRNDIAVSLGEEVYTSLNNINILSEIAKIKAKTDLQKSIEFIDQIHSKSHNMIISMDDMLWSISPCNDNMEKTIERLTEYIDALNNRHKSGIELLVNDKVKSLNLNMHFRHEAFLLFKESINGLVMANASQCLVYLTSEKSNLLFEVQFKTNGCDKERLNHLQRRQDMVKRLSTIKAELSIQIQAGTSILQLKIPLMLRIA